MNNTPVLIELTASSGNQQKLRVNANLVTTFCASDQETIISIGDECYYVAETPEEILAKIYEVADDET